ncbi:MAG: DNA repair protein RecO [Deltaproteobacteria bacterium]|nr:DNA repair protein RecO [Deltaproteobacteria bacterium]
MSSFSSSAILLRRIDHGDYDLILSIFTLNKGKVSIIAKSAKKSVKRFSGILELFSVLDIVCSTGRGRGLPILQEATLKVPFSKIRADIRKTAYASYWVELISAWMEEGEKNHQLYHLLQYVLEELDSGQRSEEALSVLFQMRLLAMAGLGPNLKECCICRIELEKIKVSRVNTDLVKGGLICDSCVTGGFGRICLSKGTIKQLSWLESGDLNKAARIRFNPQALKESLEFLETFVPYHLGSEPRSLKFLRQIRRQGMERSANRHV